MPVRSSKVRLSAENYKRQSWEGPQQTHYKPKDNNNLGVKDCIKEEDEEVNLQDRKKRLQAQVASRSANNSIYSQNSSQTVSQQKSLGLGKSRCSGDGLSNKNNTNFKNDTRSELGLSSRSDDQSRRSK